MESLFEEVTLETAQHNLPIVNCDVKGGVELAVLIANVCTKRKLG